MTVELVHLCDARCTLRTPIVIPDTPLGTRLIFEVEAARLEGERLRASATAGSGSADWVTLDARGVATLDVRLALETDDGAPLFASYRGRANTAAGNVVYSAPLFDTGDERYLWLNAIQVVAKGVFEGNILSYEMYEVQ